MAGRRSRSPSLSSSSSGSLSSFSSVSSPYPAAAPLPTAARPPRGAAPPRRERGQREAVRLRPRRYPRNPRLLLRHRGSPPLLRSPTSRRSSSSLAASPGKGHLREIFENYGEVVNVELSMDKAVNLPHGYGYVEFKMRADAEKALLYMDGAQIDGNVVKVKFALRVSSFYCKWLARGSKLVLLVQKNEREHLLIIETFKVDGQGNVNDLKEGAEVCMPVIFSVRIVFRFFQELKHIRKAYINLR